jgi:hypothetical protein
MKTWKKSRVGFCKMDIFKMSKNEIYQGTFLKNVDFWDFTR